LIFGPKLKSFNFIKKRESAIKKGEAFFDKYGWGGIIIGRLIPAIRPFIPFIAGLSAMRAYIFLISSVIACVIWSIALAILIVGIDNIINFFNFL
jgi:membrane protein DedA with SNARE-associated domain